MPCKQCVTAIEILAVAAEHNFWPAKLPRQQRWSKVVGLLDMHDVIAAAHQFRQRRQCHRQPLEQLGLGIGPAQRRQRLPEAAWHQRKRQHAHTGHGLAHRANAANDGDGVATARQRAAQIPHE